MVTKDEFYRQLEILRSEMATKKDLEALRRETVTKDEFYKQLASLRSEMATKEELKAIEQRLNDILQNMATKNMVKRLGDALIESALSMHEIVIEFMASRELIGYIEKDSLLKMLSSISRSIRATISTINPVKLTKEEWEVFKKLLNEEFDKITSKDCDVLIRIFKKLLWEGVDGSGKALVATMMLRAILRIEEKKKQLETLRKKQKKGDKSSEV